MVEPDPLERGKRTIIIILLRKNAEFGHYIL